MKCSSCNKTLISVGDISADLRTASELQKQFPGWSVTNPVLYCIGCEQTELQSTWQRMARDYRQLPKGDR